MIWPEIPILLPQSRMERVQLLVEEKKKAVLTPQKWLKTSAGLLFKNIAWCDSNVSRNNTATFGSDVLFMVGYRCVRRRCCCGLFRVGLLCLGHVMFSALLHQTK